MKSRGWVVVGAALLCLAGIGCSRRDTTHDDANRRTVTERSAPPAPGAARAARQRTSAKHRSTRPVIVLDPGHNGGNSSHLAQIDALVPAGDGAMKPCNTTGTATDAGYAEHAFNWDVAQRVRDLLRPDARIVLTRSDDAGVGPCVDERAAIGNEAAADAVVSIHADGSMAGHGFHVIRAAGDPGGQRDRSRALAVAVHDRMRRDSGLTPATYVGEAGYNTRSDLAGLNLSTRPSILLECGNMRDPGDAAVLSSPTGRQRIAAAIAAGIRGYLDDTLR